MNFNITYDSSVANAPVSFRTTVAAVAQFFQNAFSNPITINISVGYGEVGGSSLSSGALGESLTYLASNTYSQIKNALVADAKSDDDKTAVASLASVDPTNGGNFWVPTAEAKALGLSGASSSLDGSVGFSAVAAFDYDKSNGISPGQYDFYGVVAHEISEVMGRQLLVGAAIGTSPNGYDPLDLFHYSAPGVRSFVGDRAGYFSIDGGSTNLNDFNAVAGGDAGDWAASAGNDSALAFGGSGVVQTISQVDLKLLDILGYDRVIAPTTSTTSGVNPDGSSWVKVADVANSTNWVDYITNYDGAGKITSVFYDNRDGGTTHYYYDVNNQQRYADVVYYQDSLGHSHDIVYDMRDGTHKTYQTDFSGASQYSLIVSNFDQQWKLTDVVYDNRDGTHTSYTYNLGGGGGYTKIASQFDSQWHRTAVVYDNTNGTHTSYTYDVGNLQPFTGTISHFTDAWVRTDVTYLERDGSQITYNYSSPVVLDLDGNGIDLTPLGKSTAHFDLVGTGQPASTAWVGGHDGLLVIDLGADGQPGPDGAINQAGEVNFTKWAPTASSDLQALSQVFDTNHDGVLDGADARWSEFRIWVDGDHDGVSKPAELHTLDDLGIIAINLSSSGAPVHLSDGSTIVGTSTFLRADGTSGLTGDVSFASVVSSAGAPAPADNFAFASSAIPAANANDLTQPNHAIDGMVSALQDLPSPTGEAQLDVHNEHASFDPLSIAVSHDYHLI